MKLQVKYIPVVIDALETVPSIWLEGKGTKSSLIQFQETVLLGTSRILGRVLAI